VYCKVTGFVFPLLTETRFAVTYSVQSL
jgi:hypothetical protein